MTLTRGELQAGLAELDAAVEDLRADYEDEGALLDAINALGDRLAEQAGAERSWVEDQVQAILVRRGLRREGLGAIEGEED